MTLDDTPIADTTGYNAGMAKSLIDKIYFMDKIEADLIVDYGCADGELIAAMRMFDDNATFVGYDASKEMADEAAEKHGGNFTADWGKVQEAIDLCEGKKALILSSVIHEVYNYCNPTEIEEFWVRVWGSGFDYVVIRDMMVSNTASRPADPISVARVRQLADPKQITDWEGQWGSINDNWSLVHYLLTYRYTANWERELHENYFPLATERFLSMIPREYMPNFIEHYTLPFVRNVVEKDFGVQLQERTHLKLIVHKA